MKKVERSLSFKLDVDDQLTALYVLAVHQSPVSTQRHSPRDPFELGEAASPSSYCPDYTVRALTDLQLIKVSVGAS